MTIISQQSRFPKEWLYFVLLASLVGSTLWLRFANLGYSNLQGDEIKALCQPIEGQSLPEFLLSQRKGPIQFLVTCIVSIFDPSFSSELALRLTFATANSLAVFLMFELVRLQFSPTLGLYAALFLATNGLIVALGRIIQYQSIAILCTVAGIYFLSLAVQNEKWKIRGLYGGSIFAAVGILAHFDSLFVLPPMVFLLWKWINHEKKSILFSTHLKHLFLAALIFFILIAIFYIPYYFNLTDYQLEYWNQRLTQASSRTIQLFRFYNPGPVVWIYITLIIIGLLRLRWKPNHIMLLIWMAPPFIFIEFIMGDPRTHFYTYLLPLTVLVALGFETIQNGFRRLFGINGQRVIQTGCIILFGFLFFLSNKILVDHSIEYPWQPKAFLTWKLYGGELEGTFGFPYFRHWREVGEWFAEKKEDKAIYTTNEKLSLVSFYLPSSLQYQEIDENFIRNMNEDQRIYFIQVEQPQSWQKELLGCPLEDWNRLQKPLLTFDNEAGTPLVLIYHKSRQELQSIQQCQK